MHNSPPPASVRSAGGPDRDRAWHPRVLGNQRMRSSLPSGKSSTPPARCIHSPQRDTSSTGYRLLVSLASVGASRELSSRRSPALAPYTCAVCPTFLYGAFFFVASALAALSSARLTAYGSGIGPFLFIVGRGAGLHYTCCIALTTSLAIASASGGGTELPICLYLSHLVTKELEVFWKSLQCSSFAYSDPSHKSRHFHATDVPAFNSFCMQRLQPVGRGRILQEPHVDYRRLVAAH